MSNMCISESNYTPGLKPLKIPYGIIDKKTIEDITKLPLNIKKYSTEQILTLQKALALWLAPMEYYKTALTGCGTIDDKVKKLFQEPGKYNALTYNALKAFSICYGLEFKNRQLTKYHIKAFENISRGLFGQNSNGDNDFIYRLKTGRGEFLYNAIMKKGLPKAMAIIAGKNPLKIYKKNERSEDITIIQICLNKWLSNLKNPNKKLDNKLGITGVFDKNTEIALKLFNARFGIKAGINEFAEEHLAIFRNLLDNKANLSVYPFKTDKQKRYYNLLCKYGYKDTYAALQKEERKRLLASRFGLFNQFFNDSRIYCDCTGRHYHGYLTPDNIEEKLGTMPELNKIIFPLINYLQSYGYKITISSGKRSWGCQEHLSGKAFDMTVSNYDGNIIKYIQKFKNQNGYTFEWINEYLPENRKYSIGGSNIHLYI